MSEPSKQAMAAAACPFCDGAATTDKYVLDKDKRGWSAHCPNRDCSIKPYTLFYDTEAEAIAAWNNRPDHTAPLRAEVEALRARVAEHEDLITVWEWVNKHGGEIKNHRFISLRHPNSIYHGTGRTFDFDSVGAAAKWIRHEVEMGMDK